MNHIQYCFQNMTNSFLDVPNLTLSLQLEAAAVLWIVAILTSIPVIVLGLTACCLNLLCLCCAGRAVAWLTAFLSFAAWALYLAAILLFGADPHALKAYGSSGALVCPGSGRGLLGLWGNLEL